ncbi:acetamidase/formamidase family protein [Shouchella sp. JSM 1781072]|uniref:acetamidase/formamidase family protein n=1 Tax=Bacillaceae TaxID=186817 RepID=UPI000C07C2F0|nr:MULTISPECIES: acetamidase/formamidase family protein [Bacillaceae]UTR08133.1 acetamidase/formamidase family protein [Alkalihalobacillus sp. LMS6]
MNSHHLAPSRLSLHNAFNRDLKPVLSIHSGEQVIFKTLDSGWGKESRTAIGERRQRWTDIIPENQAPFFGHALTGPVEIKGAMPGDVIAVNILDIVPGSWGWASAGGFKSDWNKRLNIEDEQEVLYDYSLNHKTMRATSQFKNFDYSILMKPFMGIMGLAPKDKGFHSTFPPRNTGGNIDCKDLQKGSTLYLPVEVAGGLFSVGDGHAAQGNGEISGPALECPMEKVHLEFHLLKDMSIERPRAITQDHYITLAFHENVEEAMWLALEDMINWMQKIFSFTKVEATLWASLAVDLSLTQVVNGTKGVHASLKKDQLVRG